MNNLKSLDSQIIQLGGLLVALFAKAEEIQLNEDFAKYFEYKNDLQHFREMSKKAAITLSQLSEQANKYEIQLSNYIDNKLYKNDYINQDTFLRDIIFIRKESISAIRNLIRDLSFTKNKEDYLRLRNIYQKLVKLTNRYISAVNLIVNSIDSLNQTSNRLGIDLQNKYQLELLTKQDIFPRGKYNENIFDGETIDTLIEYLLN
jgi:hypothetical protein